MKVLITGAAGFIGFHLVRSLVKQNYQVVGIDNINDYYDINLKYARLSECGIDKNSIQDGTLLQSGLYSNYFFCKLDLVNLNGLELLFRNESFDVVINLAAQAGVRYSIENPHDYIQSNVVGFMNILECCRHSKINHLIYASSSSVYGLNSKIPFSINDRVDLPVSLYAATKRSNELMAYTYSHLYKLPTTGLRFFTVYGPWGRPDMAYFSFTKNIFNRTPIDVFNKGDLERDFTYIDDIVDGITKVIERFEENDYYRIFNLGNCQPVKLLDFVHILEKYIGISAVLNYKSMQPGDVLKTFAEISESTKYLGYLPQININEGLRNFVGWYREYYVLN